MRLQRVAGLDLPQQECLGRGGIKVFGQRFFAFQKHDQLFIDRQRVAPEAQQGDLRGSERGHAVKRIEVSPLLFLALAGDRVHLHVVLTQVHPVQGLLQADDPLGRVGVVLANDAHEFVGVAGPHVVDVDQLAHQRDKGVFGGTSGRAPLQKPDHQLRDRVAGCRVFSAVSSEGFFQKRREFFSGVISLFRHGASLPRRLGRGWGRGLDRGLN